MEQKADVCWNNSSFSLLYFVWTRLISPVLKKLRTNPHCQEMLPGKPAGCPAAQHLSWGSESLLATDSPNQAVGSPIPSRRDMFGGWFGVLLLFPGTGFGVGIDLSTERALLELAGNC